MATVRLPPGCGKHLDEPLLYSEYQQRFIRARRLRFCLACKTLGSMNEMGKFTCPKCGKVHEWSPKGNLTAPRAFKRFGLLTGRGGGKTLVGAHAVREELMIPNSTWYVAAATYKLLWDSTFPTLVGLIDPKWIKRWDSEHEEITLTNESKIAFRSLEDPERMRGPHGVAGMWIDEAAQASFRGWEVGIPMLIKAGGIAIATTSVFGYDWTYDEIEKRALIYHTPGYWMAKWHTKDNPLFKANPVMMDEIENARKTMTPALFAQEYEAERANSEQIIYGDLVEKNWLPDDATIKTYIEEWPDISPSRKVLIGLDEGADHPFGAVLIVVTERGLVVVRDYLERNRAYSQVHGEIYTNFGLSRFDDKVFSANKNAKELILEWSLKGTGIVPAENSQEIGIQRMQSWLHSGQFKVAYTAPRTRDQLRAYRRKDNTRPSTGEKTEKEQVFKLKDELPDACRYAVMAWPELPDAKLVDRTPAEQRRWDAFDDKTRQDIEEMQRLTAKKKRGEFLDEAEDNYPVGNMWQHVVDDFDEFGGKEEETEIWLGN